MITPESINITLETLQPQRTTPAETRNHLCICISDVHFTDGTVGTQSAAGSVWQDFFDEVVSTCKENAITELTLILDGDVADMIRTAVWAQEGVYPWERQRPEFPRALRKVMQGIIALHARDVEADDSPHGYCGFFHFLRHLPQRLESNGVSGVHIETLVLLGNHDKEIFADEDTLKLFYEECLGQKITELSPQYRRWIGKMYFDDEDHFLDEKTVPWLPFYWGDKDMRLFVTHGQWRDGDNSRRIDAEEPSPGWTVKDGWRADTWRQLAYRPFIEPCFGDTVAAGVLSTFIFRAKQKINAYQQQEQNAGRSVPNLHRIERILDELDLYRPSSLAVKRILQETRRKSTSAALREIIEKELYLALCQWLGWDFTLQSSPPARRLALKAARIWLLLTGWINAFSIQLTLVRAVLGFFDLMERFRPMSVYRKDGVRFKDIRTFPTFQKAFWDQGFRIHGEGHTHVPWQAEADEPEAPNVPNPHNNFTYINFGTWRDQIVTKENPGYRRRGVGRALYVLNLPNKKSERFRYYVADGINWSDDMDNLNR